MLLSPNAKIIQKCAQQQNDWYNVMKMCKITKFAGSKEIYTTTKYKWLIECNGFANMKSPHFPFEILRYLIKKWIRISSKLCMCTIDVHNLWSFSFMLVERVNVIFNLMKREKRRTQWVSIINGYGSPLLFQVIR